MAGLLEIDNLTLSREKTGDPVVKSVSFSMQAGEIVGIVGESGSGKTMVARSILRLVPPGLKQASGSIVVNGRNIADLLTRELRSVRGGVVGMIFQEPMTSLNPSMKIGRQLEEGLRLHRQYPRNERHRRIVDMLSRVGIRNPEAALDSYPHQFSGGMRQRIMIASTMLLEPQLLIADEPTTALDAIVQKDVLELMIGLARAKNTAILIVSHDLAMISRYTDRTIVMAQGAIVEAGPTSETMGNPTHPYTRKLLASIPRRAPARIEDGLKPLIEVKGLAVDYPTAERMAWKAASKRVVDNIELNVYPGEVVAVVGESGSGKTTIGKAITGLLQPSAGVLLFEGMPVQRRSAAYQAYRRNCQMVFQDPYSSLDPRMSIGALVSEPLRLVSGLGAAERRERMLSMLNEVGLAAEFAERLPHQLSGGQRQRVAIARALIGDPKFIVADEPVSALDVTIRAQVLDLFNRLQQRHGFSCLFISHDLDVVEAIADRVYIMRAGGIVECGKTHAIFTSPSHDYTRQLLASRS
ncbi:ABC transporter ATP-binding protein [Rhizobium sp. P38BS-XIX]|uniref:dipeptide ABC transporter ATP-binding protein n=1 Tax=Rhizobium sp. P38BS-XIX TaxID=2726740 RepID=UPI0014566801|nr:ABC transporter ATP-binding protein [Rhizobium sp. P38BS-XIX]NLR99898.1 ABC transporter ATP-binding protein [Rhizobium sp. P38BS-XIX]